MDPRNVATSLMEAAPIFNRVVIFAALRLQDIYVSVYQLMCVANIGLAAKVAAACLHTSWNGTIPSAWAIRPTPGGFLELKAAISLLTMGLRRQKCRTWLNNSPAKNSTKVLTLHNLGATYYACVVGNLETRDERFTKDEWQLLVQHGYFNQEQLSRPLTYPDFIGAVQFLVAKRLTEKTQESEQ